MDPVGTEPTIDASSSREFGPPTLAERIDDALVRLDGVRNRPFVAVGAAVLVGALLITAWAMNRSDSGEPVENLIPQVSLETTLPEAASSNALVVVHVSGAVRSPGVFTLPASARVLDAVEAAGGVTPDADVHLLNLAAPLVDGSQIRVPAIGEDSPVGAPGLVVGPDAVDGGIDINRATAADLERLNGVGPSIATAIIAYREENGPFARVDDLLLVPGIGPAKLAGIGDAAVVR